MSQPEPQPGAPKHPGWRLGILIPAFALLGQFIPFLLLLLPVPVAVLTDQRGWRAGVGWSLAAAGAAALFRWATLGARIEIAQSLPFLLAGALVPLFAAAMGLAGGMAYRRDGRPVLTYLAPAFLALGIFALAWVLGWVLAGIDVVRTSVEAWRAMMEETLIVSLEAGGVSADQVEAWRARLEELAAGVRLLLPSSLAVTAAAWSLLVQWLAGRWLLALGRPLRPEKPFVRWRFPWILAWGYIIGQILLLALRVEGVAWPAGTMLSVGLNLVFFFTYLFFIEGLAVVWFYLTKWGAGKGVRWLVTVFLVTPLLPLVEPVAWLGMLDAWLDFRKLQREAGP